MRIIPAKINTNTNQLLRNTDFYFNDSVPLNNQVEAKKPLPKVPAEMMHISPISGGNTTWSDDPLLPTPNDPQSYYQPYYYPQQNYHQPYSHYYPQYYQEPQQYSAPSTVVGGSEWKTATKNELQRSDSLKIETSVPSSSCRFSNSLETHMEKPFEPPTKVKELHKKISKLEIEAETSEEEDSSSNSEEQFFDHPNSSSASVPSIPSPWTTTTNMKRSLSQDNIISHPPEFQNYRLSIASCSLINDKSNIKLYRRMAIKTRSTETQLAYAKYLIQISTLYKHAQPSSRKPQQTESPSQIRHRLLLEAGYWIERLAKSGSPEALFIQGKWYLLGPQAEDCVIYSKAQETKALHCFIRASRGGWADAHYELANLWKKKGNFKRAVYYYDIGAKDNHTPSIYKMAKIYLRGQLKVNKDLNKGLEYLLRAANMNDPDCAEPAFVVACIYAKEFQRIGVDRYVDNEPIESLIAIEGDSNDSLALKYLKKSAHFGYVDAIYFMGQAFEKGIMGQSVDPWEAYQYYMKASEMNHPEAMLDLSRTYFQGIPGLLTCQKDFAFKWCKRAADLGYDQAEYTLGQYYEDGVGVQKDFALALEYFGRAASKGYQPAAEKLNRPVAEKKNASIHGDDENEQMYFLKNSAQLKSNTPEHNHCTIQ